MLESNVKIGVTEISPRAVQQAAELNFKNGYYCCEALMATIKQEFKLDVPDSVIAMASGMAVGAGKSGCVCGHSTAVSLHLVCSSVAPSRTVQPIQRV